MTRSITLALLVALVSLATVATKRLIEDDTEARCDDQESIREYLLLQTASAICETSAAQMKEQRISQLVHPHEGEFSFWMMEGETEIILSGYITHGVARRLSEFLTQAPPIRAIGFYSGGGRISEAVKVRDLIRSQNIDTYVYKTVCLPALLLFLVASTAISIRRVG